MANINDKLIADRNRRIEEEMARFESEILQSSTIADGAATTTVNQSSNSKTPAALQFVPHAMHTASRPTLNRPSGMTANRMSSQQSSANSATIEAGPTRYLPAAQSTIANEKNDKSTNDDEPSAAAAGSSKMLTQVLPADVELLAAKRQQEVAYQNSYIGQVLRGEKKMKRFVRVGGGQTWEDSSLAEWDPNDYRIFCGDLGNEVSDELLAKAFRKYPSFQKAKVVREKRTNKSKGYGFVSFKDPQDFIRASREMDGKYVGNRPIKLRKSNWKERNMDEVKKKSKQKSKLGLRY